MRLSQTGSLVRPLPLGKARTHAAGVPLSLKAAPSPRRRASLGQLPRATCCAQVVFDLPQRLQAALKQGALEVAVDAYAEAAPLLKKYGHKVRLLCRVGASWHGVPEGPALAERAASARVEPRVRSAVPSTWRNR